MKIEHIWHKIRAATRVNWFGLIKRTRHARDSNESVQPNIQLRVLFSSGFVTVASVAALLWLTGFLDWRGTKSETELNIEFSQETAADQPALPCSAAIRNFNQISAWMDLQLNPSGPHILQLVYSVKNPSEPKSTAFLAKTMNMRIVANKVFEIARQPHEVQATGAMTTNWFQSSSNMILWRKKDLIHFTGFGEQEIVFRLSLKCGDRNLLSEKSVFFRIKPSVGFELVESSPPAVREGNGNVWELSSGGYEGTYLFDIRTRSSPRVRMDHFLDASIAAVLGVAAGAGVTSWISILLLRRRRFRASKSSHRPSG